MKQLQGFELMTNTEPIRMSVHGKTVAELFLNCLRGMAEIMKPAALTAGARAKKVTQTMRVEAVDLNTLLVEFLSETIGLSDINNLIFTHATFKDIGDNFLEGEISGVPAGEIEREIKAVSYQDVDIRRNPKSGFYETTLVFEV
ncbi:MAG: archease [bacterium]|nr:archease [bacterium]MDZ4285620.1 archease [Candidatus Sungbacteria bacterium]